MKNCAQVSAKGGIIQKFEFRHLSFDLTKAQSHLRNNLTSSKKLAEKNSFFVA